MYTVYIVKQFISAVDRKKCSFNSFTHVRSAKNVDSCKTIVKLLGLISLT